MVNDIHCFPFSSGNLVISAENLRYKLAKYASVKQVHVIYLLCPWLRAGCNTRSILKRVYQVLIQSFPSPRLVAIPRLKRPVCSTIYP